MSVTGKNQTAQCSHVQTGSRCILILNSSTSFSDTLKVFKMEAARTTIRLQEPELEVGMVLPHSRASVTIVTEITLNPVSRLQTESRKTEKPQRSSVGNKTTYSCYKSSSLVCVYSEASDLLWILFSLYPNSYH